MQGPAPPVAAATPGTAAEARARPALPPGNAGGAGTTRTRHQCLDKLEALAWVEVQQMRPSRCERQARPIDGGLVWLGLAWDLGLTGAHLVDLTPPA